MNDETNRQDSTWICDSLNFSKFLDPWENLSRKLSRAFSWERLRSCHREGREERPIQRLKVFGPSRQRRSGDQRLILREKLQRKHRIYPRARSGNLEKFFIRVPLRVPPQKAEDENVVFEMNNSPVTPLPFPPSLRIRIRASWTRRNCESNCGLGLNRHRGLRDRLAKGKRKKKKAQSSQVWIETLISRWIDSQQTERVFQEQFLENLPLVALRRCLPATSLVTWRMPWTCEGAKVW